MTRVGGTAFSVGACSGALARGSVPVRGALGEQPVLVAVRPLAPAAVGVVGGLLGQHHEVFAEVDHAVVVAAWDTNAGIAHERQGYRRKDTSSTVAARTPGRAGPLGSVRPRSARWTGPTPSRRTADRPVRW